MLQLKSNATDAEIRSNYKKLALKCHPDKNGGIETEEVSIDKSSFPLNYCLHVNLNVLNVVGSDLKGIPYPL